MMDFLYTQDYTVTRDPTGPSEDPYKLLKTHILLYRLGDQYMIPTLTLRLASAIVSARKVVA